MTKASKQNTTLSFLFQLAFISSTLSVSVMAHLRGIDRVYNKNPHHRDLDGVKKCSFNQTAPNGDLQDAVDNFAKSEGDCGSIDTWDVSKVTNMDGLFQPAFSLDPIPSWDYGDISSWDVSSVTSMNRLFMLSRFNGDISSWDVSRVTSMDLAFAEASDFNRDISQWKTSSVKSMFAMFQTAREFNMPIGNWDTSSVTNMRYMFAKGTTLFNQDISQWDTSKVADMSYLFLEASSFNQDISGWDTSKVTDMKAMFHKASSFNQGYLCWDTTSVVNSGDIFIDSGSLDNSVDCPPAGMRINFSTLTGFQFSLNNVKPDATISEVKTMIHNQQGIPVAKQGLTDGKVFFLQDDKTLDYYNIQNESTIYLIIRLG